MKHHFETGKKTVRRAKVKHTFTFARPKEVPTPCELTFEYDDEGPWGDFDRLLRKQARRRGGREIGSGFDLVNRRRDLQFRFPDHRTRDDFMNDLRSISSGFVTLRDVT